MEDDVPFSSFSNILKSSSEENIHKPKSLKTTNRNKKFNILKNYYKNSYKLENQSLRNGFGKMILSNKDTSPQFSFGDEKRFYQDFNKEEMNHYTKLFSKITRPKKSILTHRVEKYRNFQFQSNYMNKIKQLNLSSHGKCPTDFLYYIPPTNVYKYPFLPKFSFSKDKRDLQKQIKKYEYYKLNYDKETDIDNSIKKWRKRIIGGDIGLEDRFIRDKKLFIDSIEPGPGKYNPNYNFFKYKQNNGGYIGVKLNQDNNSLSLHRPKFISLDSQNIKHLIGVDTNKKKDNIYYKKMKIEFNENSKEKSDINNPNKIHLRNLKKFFVDKFNSENKSKTNFSFN